MACKLDPIRLQMKREEKGWSMREASKRMNLDQSAYLRYEKGERNAPFSVIRNMALILETSVEFLTGETDDDAPVEYLVTSEDPKLFFVVEKYKNASEKSQNTIYEYVKKMK